MGSITVSQLLSSHRSNCVNRESDESMCSHRVDQYPFLGYLRRMGKGKLNLKLPEVSKEEALRRVNLVHKAVKEFEGQFDELEGAVGMYFVGHLVGWRVLVLIHNKRTIRKYEEALGISIREEFKETGPLTEKSVGYAVVEKAKAFWKAVAGEVSVERRRELQKS